jgi:transposase
MIFVRTLIIMETALYNGQKVTDGINEGTDARQQRGLEIAALARIDRDGEFYLVPSKTAPRQTRYKVNPVALTCTCPDFETRGCKCKHIYAVECVIKRETTHHADGSMTVAESVTVTQTKKTYPQDWPNYNAAQQNEKREFQSLLADLCRDLPTPAQTGRGQRRLPMSDSVFCAVFKIYSMFSARRFTSDLCDAQNKGYIDKVPHFNSVLNTLDNPDLFPILIDLIERASLPLRSIESDFAVDSTGFAFCRFVRWYDIKYNRFTAEQQWVKAHMMCGVKTNVVTAIEIHGKDTNDSPQLPSLLATTRKNFTVKEVSADKGYTGVANHEAIANAGAMPYIAFKSNTTGDVGGVYKKMWHYFQFNQEDFLAHYHKRSNVESTVMMVKSKFGDSMRSKSDVAARNEVLCKVLCHNICCLISAMYELGIDPNFGRKG